MTRGGLVAAFLLGLFLAIFLSDPVGAQDITPVRTFIWKYAINGRTLLHSPIAISDDGSYIAAGDKGTVYLLDRSGKLLWKHSAGTAVGGVSLSADGSLIVAGYYNNVIFFDRHGEMSWTYYIGRSVTDVAISADGSYIAVGADVVHLLDRSGKLLWKYSMGELFLAISTDGSYVATGADHVVYFLSRSGKLLWKYNIGDSYVRGLSVNADASYIAVGSDNGIIYLLNRDGELLWQYSIGQANRSPYLAAVSISADGSYIAGVGDGHDVYVMDTHGKRLWKYRFDDSVADLAISADGSYVAANTRVAVYLLPNTGKPPNIPTGLLRVTKNYENPPIFVWDKPIANGGFEINFYQAKVDGGNWTNIGDVTRYTLPNALQDGTYTFEVRVVDKAGNISNSASLPFIVDTKSIPITQRIIRFPKETFIHFMKVYNSLLPISAILAILLALVAFCWAGLGFRIALEALLGRLADTALCCLGGLVLLLLITYGIFEGDIQSLIIAGATGAFVLGLAALYQPHRMYLVDRLGTYVREATSDEYDAQFGSMQLAVIVGVLLGAGIGSAIIGAIALHRVYGVWSTGPLAVFFVLLFFALGTSKDS